MEITYSRIKFHVDPCFDVGEFLRQAYKISFAILRNENCNQNKNNKMK